MKTSKHSESEIIKALKQLESGITSDIVARDLGVSIATFYQ